MDDELMERKKGIEFKSDIKKALAYVGVVIVLLLGIGMLLSIWFVTWLALR